MQDSFFARQLPSTANYHHISFFYLLKSVYPYWCPHMKAELNDPINHVALQIFASTDIQGAFMLYCCGVGA